MAEDEGKVVPIDVARRRREFMAKEGQDARTLLAMAAEAAQDAGWSREKFLEQAEVVFSVDWLEEIFDDPGFERQPDEEE